MGALSVVDCIQKYAYPHQQEQARRHSEYPYPEANGGELGISLKRAALNCDEVATEVLLHQLEHGLFGQTSGALESRLNWVQMTNEAVKKIGFSDSRFEIILNLLADTEKRLVIRNDYLNARDDPGFWNRRNSQYCLRMAFGGGSYCP